jgi:hypothetical protein
LFNSSYPQQFKSLSEGKRHRKSKKLFSGNNEGS